MNSQNPQPATLTPLKRAFLALEEAQARLAAAEGAAREPIAIIGLGCRAPGADDPAALWQLLAEGRHAVRPIPRERFDIDQYFDPDTEVPGRIAVREAAFLDVPVDGFDAGFFGISPREARGMDPQQRLLLEVAWEALEHAGQAPDRLSTSPTGVYIGQAGGDYAVLMHKAGDPALLDSHFTSGIAHSVSSGRLSYLLGLQGPSLTVDTACSSSLVAVHLACQALRARECRMALAGGVSLMLSEDIFIAFSHSRMLARDGRCKTFDAAADGFGRGEGCGVVVLKRLSDAEADGDRILAVIRGSAVNQDGPSSGLTAPNGPAQEAVIRAALAQAGLSPHDIGCIEAHGTGTQLGDPLEVQALGHVFGPGRAGGGDAGAAPAPPLWLASLKTNVGHLEAAAGVGGLIKLVLALQHRAVPPHLHLRQPSPHIPWSELPFRIPTALQPWEPIRGRRIGGVSSFGFSGTNAHVVVEEAPPRTPAGAGAAPVSPWKEGALPIAAAGTPARPRDDRAAEPPARLFTLSARSPEALRALAARHAAYAATLADDALAAACFTANAGRAAFEHRAAIVARSVGELHAALTALAAGAEAPGLRTRHLQRRDPPRIAFAFTGQGSQYAGMARGLYEGVPAFRAALDRCAEALEPHLARPLLPLLFGDRNADDEALLDRTEFTQPALFAVEVALAEMWQQLGVRPALLIGHSVGEVAAACVAGVFPLADGAALVCARARLMGALPPGGAMAAVSAPPARVQPLLATQAGVGIAAVNAPEQTVVSGPAAGVDALCAALAAQGVRSQRLKVSHAFHSSLMEPMLDAFEAAVQPLRLAPPRLRLVSNLSGQLAQAAEITTPVYWRRHVREAVRFAEGVATLLTHRPDVCIELGPQPALLGFIAPVAPALAGLPSLRRGRADREVWLEALGTLFLEGAHIDWRAAHEGEARQPIALPTYPFQRERCWFSAGAAARPAGPARPAPAGPGGHALLGSRLNLAGAARIYESRLGADAPAWIGEHRVQGHVVVPATAYLDTLLAAATDAHGAGADTVEDITVQEAMLLASGDAAALRCMQTQLVPTPDGSFAARISSQGEGEPAGQGWVCHVAARLPAPARTRAAGTMATNSATAAPATGVGLAAARAACPQPVDRQTLYHRLAASGLDFGPRFQSLQQAWQGQGQALGEVVLHASLQGSPHASPSEALQASLQGQPAGAGLPAAGRLHPVLLDGCLQVLALAVEGEPGALFMPLAIGRYRQLRAPSGPRCFAHVVARTSAGTDGTATAAETHRADMCVFDVDGTPLAELDDVQIKRVASDGLARLLDRGRDELIHEIAWRELPAPAAVGIDAVSARTAAAGASVAALPLQDMAAAARSRMASACEETGLPAYDAQLELLERLCGELVAEALTRMGVAGQAGEHLPSATLGEQLGVLPRHRELLARLLAILAGQGWLERADGTAGPSGWRVKRALREARPGDTLAALGLADAPGAAPQGAVPRTLSIANELELTLRTGRGLADALRGRLDPLDLLFPAGDTGTAERVYRDSPPARLFNGLVADAVAAAARAWQAGGEGAAVAPRPLRVLEIGAGTGGTTAHVLPRLLALPGLQGAEALRYTFTDIGALFVARARERFGPMHAGLVFKTFDLERDAAAQGLPEGGHDIVLASNVVHATRDLRRSLDRIRRLLAPGGVLVMLEACAPQAWFDLTVGFTEGWWCFEDRALRPDYPTLGSDAWLALLAECGFAPVQGIAGNGAGATATGGAARLNALLLAQRPLQETARAQAHEAPPATTAAASGPASGSASGDRARPGEAPAQHWLVVGDSAGTAGRLAARLAERGHLCERLDAGTGAEALRERLRAAHAGGRRWHRVVHAAALDATPGATPRPAQAGPGPAPAVVLGALQLAQGLVATGQDTRLVLLTHGAVAVDTGEDVAAPEAASLWGLARALRLEHPELRATCIDLAEVPGPSAAAVDRLLAELDDEGDEPERALRGTARRVPRLVRWAPRANAAGLEPGRDPHAPGWRLAPRDAGSLEVFERRPHPRRAPGPGEVEVAVEATGLNFKDVLKALGMVPGDSGPLGAECAGRVVAVGPGVGGLAPGDPVLAMAGGAFGSHVTVRREFVARRPEGIGPEEGASFAVAYVTAEFCLGHLAGLRAGQSVLVHAAAGGVGLAAVRLAQRAGATVLATAGSPGKRELLRSLGVAHVFDSRSAAFGAQVMAATDGRGVDVVLNSLADDLIDASLAATARGGCFVEIGKRGIKSHEQVRALGRDLRYHVVDWGETAAADPALVGGILARMVSGLEDGSLPLLPRHTFALDEAARAFRFMAQARHVGRIVLRHESAATWRPSRRGTYLVTGGLSGLGLATAAWLAEQGAGRLVLVGRRGVTPEAEPVLAALRARGLPVLAEALDIADEAGLAALLARLRADGPPLRGVWHSAGTLDDAALTQQDEGRFARVFAPKVQGARLLDRLTRLDALDSFVMYASAAGVLGSAGQANHAAANACLDALAQQRRARGLPGLSVDWGAWRDTGAAAGLAIGARLAAQGLRAMAPAEGLHALHRLMCADAACAPAQAAVLAIDWPTYLARAVPGGRSALLSEVAGTRRIESGAPAAATPPLAGPQQARGPSLTARLAAAPVARRRSLMASFVRERALAVLGLDAERAIDPAMPLGDLGLDSLLAVELRNALGTALGRALPATLLFDHPTIEALTEHLLLEIAGELSTSCGPGTPAAPAPAPQAGSTIVESIADLSDEEVERQLAARSRIRARTT